MKQNKIKESMFQSSNQEDPDLFIILNKKNPNPSLSNKIITKQKIPKL